MLNFQQLKGVIYVVLSAYHRLRRAHPVPESSKQLIWIAAEIP